MERPTMTAPVKEGLKKRTVIVKDGKKEEPQECLSSNKDSQQPQLRGGDDPNLNKGKAEIFHSPQSQAPSTNVSSKLGGKPQGDDPSETAGSGDSDSENSGEMQAAMNVLSDLRGPALTGTSYAPLKCQIDSKSDDDSVVITSESYQLTKKLENGSFAGSGSYVFKSSDNVDEYLKNLGVGLVYRKVQSAANPVLTIYPVTKDGEWIIKTDSIFRTREVRFRPGDEFTDETYDGRTCRTVITIESPTCVHMHQRCPTGPDVKTNFEIQRDGSLSITMNSGSNRAVIYYTPNTDL